MKYGPIFPEVYQKGLFSSQNLIAFVLNKYEIISDILTYGYVTDRASLPFSVQEYSSSSMFGSTATYVIVTSEPDNYDIRFNDIVYSIDGTRISTVNGLISTLSDYKVGDKVKVQIARTVGRDVKVYEYEITLVESVPGN